VVVMENRKSVLSRFLRNQTVKKFDIRADGFPAETACSPELKLKVIKITLLAFGVQINDVLKHY